MAVFKPQNASFLFPDQLACTTKMQHLLYTYALFTYGLLQQPYCYSPLSFILHWACAIQDVKPFCGVTGINKIGDGLCKKHA